MKYGKSFLKNILILILLSAFFFSCSKQEEQKPNILFVLLDDLGYGQFGLYNDSLETSDFDPFFVSLVDSLQGYSLEKSIEYTKLAIPSITNLANQGVVFTNAYASSNLCAPSRLGIATGVLQNRFGVYWNQDCKKVGIRPGSHLAEKMQALGYKTAHIGKWHIGTHNRQMAIDALRSQGINDTLNFDQIRKLYPEIIKQIYKNGYEGSVSNQHHPLNNGFDYYFGYNNWASQYYNSNLVWENFEHAGQQTGYNTDVFTDKALDFMEEQIANDEAFYLQLHYHAVHDSVEPKAPAKYFNRFTSDSYDLNNFYAHIYGVDNNLQRITNYLKANKQLENTIIVFSSDNGAMAGGSYKGHKSGSPLPGNAPFSGHKGNYFLGGIRVPMFFYWGKKIKQAFVSNHTVSTLDIIPTLIDAAGGKVPENIDGKSLLPILNNPKAPELHEHLCWAGVHSSKWGFLIEKSTKHHGNESTLAPAAWAVIKGDYLLRFTGTLAPGIYLDFMDGRAPVFELYNIKSDPSELNDLSNKLPKKVLELSEIYQLESANFPPPANWDLQKWDELVESISYIKNKLQ